MQQKDKIIDCYNKAAKNYVAKYGNELDHKHLDRLLLEAFVKRNQHRGKIIDLGCGPGQTTSFIATHGAGNVLGTDLSPVMIEEAQRLHPNIDFEVADMLELPYDPGSFAAAIAFYAIVHLGEPQLVSAFSSIARVLKAGGDFLFSFHTGDHILHMDEFLEQQVSIDFHFFNTAKVVGQLKTSGFSIIDVLERQPYPEEYPSTRAYIWASKQG